MTADNLRKDFESWALNTPPDERTNWEVFQAGARAALAAQPESLLMKLAGIAAECTDPDTTDALDALIAATPTLAGQSPAEGDAEFHQLGCLKGMLEDDEGARHSCTCGAKTSPTRDQLFTALNEVAELVGDCEEWAITEDPQVVVGMVKDYMAGVALSKAQPKGMAAEGLHDAQLDLGPQRVVLHFCTEADARRFHERAVAHMKGTP